MDKAKRVLRDARSNRGTAYTTAERQELGLTGRLPAAVETLDQQASRAYSQLQQKQSAMEKYIYLELLRDRNEVL